MKNIAYEALDVKTLENAFIDKKQSNNTNQHWKQRYSDRTVSKEFFNYISKEYRVLFRSKEDWRLFVFLLGKTLSTKSAYIKRTTKTGAYRIVMYSKLINSIMGYKTTPKIISQHGGSVKYLEAFSKRSGGLITKVIPPNYLSGLSTEIEVSFPVEVMVKFQQEVLKGIKEYPVYLENGEKAYLDDEPGIEFDQTAGVSSSLIVDSMRRVNKSVYTKLRPSIKQLIDDLKAGSKYKFRTELSRISLIDQLTNLYNQPIPRYRVSDRLGRIYGYSESNWQSVPGKFRKLLLGGIVFDLSSAHATIVSQTLGIKSLQTLMSSPTVWEDICKTIGLGYTELRKKAIKQALNSLIYGSGIVAVKDQLKEDRIPAKAIKAFVALPAVIELRRKTKELLKKIANEGKLASFDGTIIFLKDNDNNPMSVMARKFQDMEVKIMEAAYIYQMNAKDLFTIISHEHDGFTYILNHPKHKDEIEGGIRQAVEERALLMGIEIKTKFEYPENWVDYIEETKPAEWVNPEPCEAIIECIKGPHEGSKVFMVYQGKGRRVNFIIYALYYPYDDSFNVIEDLYMESKNYFKMKEYEPAPKQLKDHPYLQKLKTVAVSRADLMENYIVSMCKLRFDLEEILFYGS